LLLDFDLIVFVVIFFWRLDPVCMPLSIPSAVTLRLGSLIRARAVPTGSGPTNIKYLADGTGYLQERARLACKKNRRNCCIAHDPIWKENTLVR
jgi:hypothetical protein